MKQRLILMLVLTACAIGVTAADFEVAGIHYDVVAPGVVEIAPGGDYSGDFVIPTTVKFSGVEYAVQGIGKDAFRDRGVNTVFIPNTVTRIGEQAFMSTPLTEVTIPESVTAVGEAAFSNCGSLTAIKGKFATDDNRALIVNHTLVAVAPDPNIDEYIIPDSVYRIGNHTFYGHRNLKIIIITDSVRSIGDYAFSECENLTKATMGNSVKTLGEGAFYNCRNLGEVKLSNRLDTIKYRTFRENASLTHITLPNSVSTIEAEAFHASGLIEITIPYLVKEISWAAFAYCYNLRSVTLPEGLTHIEDQAFISCGSLTEIEIPKTVTSIGETAFQSCDALRTFKSKYVSKDNTYLMIGDVLMRVFPDAKLTTFTVPDNVTKIGVDAFKYCADLTTVEIPVSVTDIGDEAFLGCSALQSITLPRYVSEIKLRTFCGCHNLESITLPRNLRFIHSDAFADCHLLASIELPLGLEGIGPYAFLNCEALTSVTIPQTVRSISDGAFAGCTSLRAFNGKFASEDNRSLIDDDTMIAVACAGLTSFAVPEGIKHIASHCFESCSDKLLDIELPSTLVSAREYSLAGLANLTSITLPDSFKKLYSNAFRETDIRAVTLPASIEQLGDDVFAGSPLRSVTLESEDPESVTIDNNPFGGTDVKENGLLYVPAGTKDVYRDHWYWGQFNNIVDAQSTRANHFAGDSTKVIIDEVSLLPVTMVNEANVIGMQFDVVLPEGIALAKKANGSYYIVGSKRFYSDNYVNARDIKGGVRFVVHSASNTEFGGHDEVLFSLPVIATGEPRQAEILIRNVRLSDDKYQDIYVAPLMLTPMVQPAYTPGDVNNDGQFTVTDVTMIVAYILGNNPSNGIREAADVNGDGNITVTDLTIVVSYVLGNGPNAPMRAKAVESPQPLKGSSELAMSESGVVELRVSGLSGSTSAQFDITLSEGAAVSGVSLRGGQDHVMVFSDNVDGSVRVMAYSPTNSDFADDAAFEIALDGTGTIDMAVTGIRLAQVCGNAVTEFAAEGCSASYDLSGMADSMLAGLSVRTVAGALLITAPEACDITLYDTLGRGSRHALSAGANRIALPRGVYMLAGSKLVIR